MVFQSLVYHDYSSSNFSSNHDAVCSPGSFVNNPSIQILGLSFLILIGFMLLTESAHSNALIFGSHVTPVPKGYLYFAISFSLMEVIMKESQKKNKID
jgi:predicted tellurium resistance membrane protein TerC